MSTPLAEQAGGLISESFTDGIVSDGGMTADETAAVAANAPKDAAPSPDVDDDPPVDPNETPPDERTEEQKAEDEAAGKKPAGKKSFNARIGDLTSNWRTAQRDADTHKARAEALAAEVEALRKGNTAPLTPNTTAVSGAPDPASFDYGELDPKYIAALTRFETANAFREQQATVDQERQAQAAAARRQELNTKQATLIKAGATLYDDFDDVVMEGAKAGKWELTPALGELLLDSEFGAQITYDLAKNPDEAARVARLSPSEQAKFLGRQEAKYEAQTASPQSQARKAPQAQTPPRTPRGAAGSNKIGSDSEDFASVEAAWRSGSLK